ncbi:MULTISPECIES: PTS sugar transporter subunit IIA [Bifidobacterium]|jgi:PTS system ascorbate-specific IIA component|uniref:Ascorbate-specific PTS system EIIA component n=1 Tax=Bifidobacterium tibiigranuli TaxID=2172043 RepID=A0A5N6S704_9BIFI|nr:PTS sugar transporter subunit IIA [Bifidobacterium tibiigranuli]KAE8130193.1 PTS sugar transporter subunit IIA [Bifidobacterium tibiigranuli]KAE8130448.1 PTS sugar transporter subunit IIA [Bifidobacterium tibiigranuli]MCH3974746.1 PTS sugar transporter subunit IIA [Bifidobacterium tibiigranuli]MCH4188994.1 PTS sugar transporter subunit IIA [Bifidobacterium tibiigranuli]MCH4203714.1 PTS sugar transporter subunit IIA [Bifidobacterium tibiigranuli]
MADDPMVKARHVQLQIHADDWQDALAQTAKPLLDDRSIESQYVADMIQAVHELGPYIVLAPGFALGHARPSDAVHRPCLAIATLDEPVEFGSEQNDPVDIVIVVASTSNDAHLAMLQKVVTFLNEKNGFGMLREARTSDDAQAIVSTMNKGE